MNKTKIEWCDYTLNPITGCLNHTNGLCKGGDFPCYAYKLAHGRLREWYLANQNVAPISLESAIKGGVYGDPFYPRLWDRFTVQGIPKGSRIFLNDMSDWVGIGIPEEWTQKVLDFIRANPNYTFLTLTKQPQNLPKFSPFPENCWVGVTATKWLLMSDAIGYLATIQAKVKFISFEPLLERMQFDMMQKMLLPTAAQWLIIGAQTPYSAKTAPRIEWVKEIVEAADKAVGFIKDAVLEKDGILIVTADHGNAEGMVYKSTGETETRHESTPVQFCLVARQYQTNKTPETIAKETDEVAGILADVAPTILELMGIPQPAEMTGASLLPVLKI